jgi:glycosyltransferase 2 family protein
MDRLARKGLRLATLAAVVVGLVVAGRGVSLESLSRILRSANVATLTALALPILAVGFALRAARFRAAIGRTPVPFLHAVWTMLLTQAANNLLPLRAGEFVKTREFVAAGHAPSRVLAAQGAEKLIEATTLAVLCAPAMAANLGNRSRVLGVAALVVAIFVPLLVWTARRFRMPPVGLGQVFAWSLTADAFEVALVVVTLRSLGLPSGLGTSMTVLGAVNLAIALPSVPGHFGAFEAGAALGLVALGVAHDAAFAFAVLYRVIQWVPVSLGGAVVWGLRAAKGHRW